MTCSLVEGDAVLHASPVTHVASLWEILWPLTAGARVVLAANGEQADAAALTRLIDAERVRVAHLFPDVLRTLFDARGQHPHALGSLGTVLCCDPSNADLFGHLVNGLRVVPLGGYPEIEEDGRRVARVRGQLVDLDEIEGELRRDPLVRSCRVLAKRTARFEQRLVAYVTFPESPEPARLLSGLRARLPEAIAPSAIVPIVDLPRTRTGEIDDRTLDRLPVVDDHVVKSWTGHLRARLGTSHVDVQVQERIDRFAPVDLSSVVVDHPPAIDAAAPKAPPAARLTAANAHAPEAIRHGGPPLYADDGVATLGASLIDAAHTAPEKGIAHRLSDGHRVRQTYAELLADAERIQAGLRGRHAEPGDVVIIQLQATSDILPAFWGCVLGGFVPLVLSLEGQRRGPTVVSTADAVCRQLDRPVVITSRLARDFSVAASPDRMLLIEELREAAPDLRHHAAQPDDLAMLSQTSGSSGVPKLVMLTHRNLLARAAGTNAMAGFRPSDVVLNWLPFDHIGSLSDWNIRCVVLGCDAVYVPTEYVLGEPLRWLDLLERERITHSWAPNFAFTNLARALAREGERRWNLSHVEGLIVAGEPISPQALMDLQRRLGPCGLRPTAWRPAFGMAELGSGVTYRVPEGDAMPRFHALDRQAGTVVAGASAPTPHTSTVVDLGPIIAGASMRIVGRRGHRSARRGRRTPSAVGHRRLAGILPQPGGDTRRVFAGRMVRHGRPRLHRRRQPRADRTRTRQPHHERCEFLLLRHRDRRQRERRPRYGADDGGTGAGGRRHGRAVGRVLRPVGGPRCRRRTAARRDPARAPEPARCPAATG